MIIIMILIIIIIVCLPKFLQVLNQNTKDGKYMT